MIFKNSSLENQINGSLSPADKLNVGINDKLFKFKSLLGVKQILTWDEFK